MTKQIQAELLILGLILLGSARFLFVSHTRKDSLSVVPLVGFIFSIFNLFVFGFSSMELIILVFALWATIWNFRSILRLMSDVIVDHYDLRLVIISVINAIACGFLIFCVFSFMPASSDAAKLEVSETVDVCYGSFEKGFSEVKEPFKMTNAKIWHFEGNNVNPAGRIIVIFVPPKTADVGIYRIFLQKLAKNGYSVYAGDFWTNEGKWFNRIGDMPFMRRFSFVLTRLRDEKKFNAIYMANKNVLVQEYSYLLKLSKPAEQDIVFAVTEDDVAEVLKTVRELNIGTVKGTFDLSYLEDNPTKGFGPVENTDPVLAWHLGVEPDRSGYISSHLAVDVTDFISRQIIGVSE
ncbi:hypothetical protein [Treponema sp.]|uniref:hypothetical protein n=1 Tax=Treponema sp. TaxID=166 RepID=UPI00388F3A6B